VQDHIGAVHEELHPVGRTYIGEVFGELSLVRATFTLELGKSVRSPPSEQEGAAETTCNELTITPIPCSGGGGKETRVKLSPGRREGWGEDV